MDTKTEALSDIAAYLDDLDTLISNGSVRNPDEADEMHVLVKRIRQAQKRLCTLVLPSEIPVVVQFASLQWGGDWTEAEFPHVTHHTDDLPGADEHEMWTWPTFDGTIHVMRRHTFTSPHENRWWVLEWADENGDLDHFYIEELGDRRFTAHYNPHEGGEDETFHYDPTNIDCVITLEGGVEPSKSDE